MNVKSFESNTSNITNDCKLRMETSQTKTMVMKTEEQK